MIVNGAPRLTLPPNKCPLVFGVLSFLASLSFLIVIIVHQFQSCRQVCWGNSYNYEMYGVCWETTYTYGYSKYSCSGGIMYTCFTIITFIIGVALITFYRRKVTVFQFINKAQGFQAAPAYGDSYQNLAYNQPNQNPNYYQPQPNVYQQPNAYHQQNTYQQPNAYQPQQNAYHPPSTSNGNQGFNNIPNGIVIST